MRYERLTNDKSTPSRATLTIVRYAANLLGVSPDDLRKVAGRARESAIVEIELAWDQ